jgi:hypothetical protein
MGVLQALSACLGASKTSRMKTNTKGYRGYPFPAEILSHGVWHLKEVFVKIRGKLLRSLINRRDNECVRCEGRNQLVKHNGLFRLMEWSKTSPGWGSIYSERRTTGCHATVRSKSGVRPQLPEQFSQSRHGWTCATLS